MAASPFIELPGELRHRFERWIHSLQVRTEDRPLKDIIGSGKFLDFNYTEFIESLYGVRRSDVCYIHGRRKLTKEDCKEPLILWHQPGTSDSVYEFQEDWKGINLSGHRAQMIYDAQQVAMQGIVEADSDLTKHCDKIIDVHKSFFKV